ncbi:MAG TPA: nucleotidyltransferase family protein [Steroidobacter sp.]
MKDWTRLLLMQESTVRDALRCIDQGGVQIALVIDGNRKLLGTLSDGDVRRGLLAGTTLDSRVSEIMHVGPTVARDTDPRPAIFAKMRRLGLHQLPVVDAENRVVALQTLDDLVIPEKYPNPVVIMAGGLGTRLKELTQSVPKPMLKVGDRPILELLIETFVDQGFNDFYVAVNYKAEVIEQHFEDGSRFGARIEYLRETKRLGTAGALSLLPRPPTMPFFVANADLVTRVDYLDMLEKHTASGACATMAVREYEFQIPFGVIDERDGLISGIREKPIHRSMVCAGIYVMSPEVLPLVATDAYHDMPGVFEDIIRSGRKAASYAVRGYWLDVGRIADYHKANEDFQEGFS